MIWRRRGSQDGQAGIETAIVIPVFLAIFLVNLYLGIFGLNLHKTQMASRYAAWFENRGNGDGSDRAEKAFWAQSILDDNHASVLSASSPETGTDDSSFWSGLLDILATILSYFGGETTRKGWYLMTFPFAAPSLVANVYQGQHFVEMPRELDTTCTFLGDPYCKGIFSLLESIFNSIFGIDDQANDAQQEADNADAKNEAYQEWVESEIDRMEDLIDSTEDEDLKEKYEDQLEDFKDKIEDAEEDGEDYVEDGQDDAQDHVDDIIPDGIPPDD